jgi:hypothetical protein
LVSVNSAVALTDTLNSAQAAPSILATGSWVGVPSAQFAKTLDPGWTAIVDRRPATWTNANYLFLGVFLPPGKHTVHFRYQPQGFRHAP